ncbi:helix-turn-helix domain-containing protein [Chlorogloea sp. CCALA 695]|uniref:helix-turn-helix domain-containing protein n=1 Tax=Chlorogloea sp. CCALA 695 TaxID=2107693 RepID=UPI001E44AA02|nr:MerR family transcriptional regulator [Chlorogloea sp. CCALA 695]
MTDKMRIGELSQIAGVTPRTIRYYENLGLLSPNEREGKGFRYYSQTELAKLQKIDCLKSLGLTLEEITTFIDLYFQDSTDIRGKQKVLEILQFHLKETDEKIAALEDFRSDLKANILKIQQQIQELSSQ